MKTLEVEDATAPLSEYARSVKESPFVVMEGGRPIAALIPIVNADEETVSLSLNPKFIAIIERSMASLESEGGISLEEVRRRLGV